MVIISPTKFPILVCNFLKDMIGLGVFLLSLLVMNFCFILTVYLCPVGILGHMREEGKAFSMQLANRTPPSNSSWRITEWLDPEISCISSVHALRAAEVSQQESLLSQSMLSLGKGESFIDLISILRL